MGHFYLLPEYYRDQGATVAWAVSDVDIAARTITAENFNYLQSPVATDRFQEKVPVSFSDILLHYGYANPAVLYDLTTAWRDLLAHTGAKLLLADHAPTAILAARTLDIQVILSYGFCVPPPVTPLPCLRHWIRNRQNWKHWSNPHSIPSILC